MMRKIKIKYIVNARIPTEKAHGYQVCKMCEEFSRADLDVELIVPKRKNIIMENIFNYYGLENNFKITKLFCFDLVFCGYLGFWIQRISFLISLKLYLLKNKYDYLYSREDFLGIFFRDFILELHTLPNKRRYLYKYLLSRAKSFIVLNSYLKRELIDNYSILEKRILISPDGVDLKKFNNSIPKNEARKRLSLSIDKKIILYTGHLYRWKGTDVLAEASKLFKDDFEFVFVGGTQTDLKSFREKYSKYDNVKIIGQRSHSEIPLYLSSADVLVLPNSGKEKISRFYTSPLKLFEYMASGIPIVASSLPSIREILNEDNSCLAEADNSEALARVIKEVLAYEDFGNKISEQALEDVKKYSWSKRANNIFKFIKK